MKLMKVCGHQGVAAISAAALAICMTGAVSGASGPAPVFGSVLPDFDLPPGFASSPLGLNARFAVAAPNFDRAHAAAVSECMARVGVEYTGDPPGLGQANSVAASVEQIAARRYTPPEQRDGRWGYVFDDVTDDAIGAPAPEPSAEQAQALWGDRSDTVTIFGVGGEVVGELSLGTGCVAEGIQAVIGSLEDYADFVQVQARIGQIDGISFDNLVNDPEANAIAEAWRACMASAGYGDVQLPFLTANGEFPSPRPGSVEEELASSDASCRAETDVDQALLGFEVRFSTVLAQSEDPGLQARATAWIDKLAQL